MRRPGTSTASAALTRQRLRFLNKWPKRGLDEAVHIRAEALVIHLHTLWHVEEK